MAEIPAGVAAQPSPRKLDTIFVAIYLAAVEFSGTDGNKKRSIGPIADAARFTIPPFSAIFISPTQNAMAPVIVRQRLTASFAEASAWSVTAPRFPVIAAYTTPTRIIPPHNSSSAPPVCVLKSLYGLCFFHIPFAITR